MQVKLVSLRTRFQTKQQGRPLEVFLNEQHHSSIGQLFLQILEPGPNGFIVRIDGNPDQDHRTGGLRKDELNLRRSGPADVPGDCLQVTNRVPLRIQFRCPLGQVDPADLRFHVVPPRQGLHLVLEVLPKGSKFQFLEERDDPGRIQSFVAGGRNIDRNRRIPAKLDQFPRLPELFTVFFDRLTKPFRGSIGVFEQPIQRAGLLKDPPRVNFPDAGNSGNVVHGITDQTKVVGHPYGRNAQFLPYPHGIQHFDVGEPLTLFENFYPVLDQLKVILIVADQDQFKVLPVLPPVYHAGEQIVALEPGFLHHRDAEPIQ